MILSACHNWKPSNTIILHEPEGFQHQLACIYWHNLVQSNQKFPWWLVPLVEPNHIKGAGKLMPICSTIKLSSKSAWLLDRHWLSCIQHLSCSVSFQCMLKGSVEVWTKEILYQFIEGQTQFYMPRGAEMSVAVNKLNQVALHSNSNTDSKHAPQVEINYQFSMQIKKWKIMGHQLPTKTPIEKE